jgi:thiamine-phosphate pyrophosphorylase
MARCYSGSMRQRHCLPDVWVISDRRNESRLDSALRSHSRRVALVFRHYHLGKDARRKEFDRLSRIARSFGHLVILAADAPQALSWGADGHYAPPRKLRPKRSGLIVIATAHTLVEIVAANRSGADAVMLSPVFPTRSHPGGKTLGPVHFRLLARYARVPVIALGGMNRQRSHSLKWEKWAAIDGV